MVDERIYLDYNSTTPVDPLVLDAMLPYFSELFENATSAHLSGVVVKKAVEKARWQVANLIGADPEEIIFTSSSTEAINLGLKGFLVANPNVTFYTNRAEHKAVLDTCDWLKGNGADVKYLEIDADGLVSSTDQPGLVVQMLANNETGVINRHRPKHKQHLFLDATQAVGKINVDVIDLEADMLAFSSHKIYGPKGIGALYSRRGIRLAAQIHGGGHERGLRSGTLNVPAIVGFGAACELCQIKLEEESNRMRYLRDEVEQELLTIEGAQLNGFGAERLPNTTNISFQGLDGTLLVGLLGPISISNGSACASSLVEPSHVLKAMGFSDEHAHSSVRISIGRYTTKKQIETATDKIRSLINAHRY
jgi:cysteine desulfurase